MSEELRDATAASGEEATRSAFHRWNPEPLPVVFRMDIGTPEARPATLIELSVRTAPEGGTPTEVRAAFDVSADQYAAMERGGWFGLKDGTARAIGFGLLADRPVRISASVDPARLVPFLLPTIDPEAPADGIGELVSCLLDPSVDGLIQSPLAWQWERVLQSGADGSAVGFDRAVADEYERTVGPIVGAEPLAPVFAPASPEEAAGVSTDAPGDVWAAQPGSPAYFLGADLAGATVTDVRAVGGAAGVAQVRLTLEVSWDVYARLDALGLFGLDEAAKAQSTFSSFDASLPVEISIALDPAWIAPFSGLDPDPAQAIRLLLGALANPEGVSPFRDDRLWTYSRVLQQPAGQSFKVGYSNPLRRDVELG
jgi:hypothetical protein